MTANWVRIAEKLWVWQQLLPIILQWGLLAYTTWCLQQVKRARRQVDRNAAETEGYRREAQAALLRMLSKEPHANPAITVEWNAKAKELIEKLKAEAGDKHAS